MIEALGRQLPAAVTQGVSAGLHVVCGWPGLDETAVASAARARGVAVATLAGYRIAPGEPGLVLGYGNITDAGLTAAIDRLAAVVRAGESPSRGMGPADR